jgi:hypothetical protein
VVEIVGQEEDPRETLKVTSGGFEPSEAIEVAVNPTGEPSSEVAVIKATPEACLRKAAFRASVASVFMFSVDIE